jgi:putative flavoprotein involved in K+ transport
MKTTQNTPERVHTVVIGGGQAGLSAGHFLKERNIPFVILEANERVGDSWRTRWDSLRLFTPARYDGIAGLPFSAPPHSFPTKDEMADYLESYVAHFNLPVRTGVRVDRLSKPNGHFLVSSNGSAIEAENVVVAMANFQQPRVPPFADQLDPEIVQLHSREYRNPAQLKKGEVLIVGAGNSGAEIGVEVARTHRTWMSGRNVGYVPFNIAGVAARLFLLRAVLRGLFHRILTVNTPMGRKMRPTVLTQGGPLIRTRPVTLDAAGIERVPRVSGVKDGKPQLEDGRILDVANVIWCTGFHPGFSWIDLPVFSNNEPEHYRGIVRKVPGLYFVGLHFLYAFSSTMIHGVERDAEFIVRSIASRMNGR